MNKRNGDEEPIYGDETKILFSLRKTRLSPIPGGSGVINGGEALGLRNSGEGGVSLLFGGKEPPFGCLRRGRGITSAAKENC